MDPLGGPKDDQPRGGLHFAPKARRAQVRLAIFEAVVACIQRGRRERDGGERRRREALALRPRGHHEQSKLILQSARKSSMAAVSIRRPRAPSLTALHARPDGATSRARRSVAISAAQHRILNDQTRAERRRTSIRNLRRRRQTEPLLELQKVMGMKSHERFAWRPMAITQVCPCGPARHLARLANSRQLAQTSTSAVAHVIGVGCV